MGSNPTRAMFDQALSTRDTTRAWHRILRFELRRPIIDRSGHGLVPGTGFYIPNYLLRPTDLWDTARAWHG